MNTPLLPTCPKCGVTLPVDAPKGLCPRCLAAMNLATETVLTGADALAAQPPLSPAELAPHFPQLEIIECLGRGGMGVVYKARQKSLNRVVALKLLAPERAADAQFALRFAHEAQALAALNHPSIVTIYDFGQAGGFYFLLMEFVDGVNLRQAMKAGRFTPEQALAVVPPVCEALQYAHEHGIVHRDIKPENLLLDKEGRVKIADFGIAKLLHADGSDVGVADSQPAGTPQYMAPEQKAHRSTDHRVDIYSLGVVLYELLTGELPADKLQPPSRKVLIDVRLNEIVLRALEKTPELRYQTAGEMRTQVETVVSTPRSSQGNEASPPGKDQSLLTSAATGQQPRLSRTAIVGACWVPFFLLAFVGMSISRDVPAAEDSGPAWWQIALMVTLVPLGAAAPFGTTLLGWIAVAQIRRSSGRLHGMWLAVFDGLLFPMAGLVWVIAFFWWWLFREVLEPAIRANHQPLSLMEHIFVDHTGAFMALATGVTALLAGYFIVRGAWRAVNGSAEQPDKFHPPATRLLGAGVIVAGLVLWGLLFFQESRAYNARVIALSSEIHRLQQQWTAANTEAFQARTAVSRFEANAVNARTDSEREKNEIERRRLTDKVAQAGKLSADLQQRIPAATEAVNQLRFPSAGLLTKLLWSVAPFLLIGLALLFWRSGSAPGPPPGSRATTVALGIVWWFAAFPFVAYCMGAIHASESFSIVAMMIALAFVAMIARRKTDQWHSAGDAERGSRWLRAFSWLGWLLAAVAVALALFCLYSLMSETGPWNPAPSEGALATLDFLGVALLPWAATHLRKVARWEADPNHPTPMPSVRAPFQYAAFMLLIPLLTIGCFFAVYLFSRSAQPSGVTHFICIPVGVSNNVVIVDVTTVVRRGNAELRPLLEGPRLPAATEASFQDAFTPPFSGTFIKPTPYSGNQVFRLLPTRRQTSRLGFVLPTAALAQDAFDNLRSIGPLPAEPGRTFAGTLFEVSQPNGATYRASMQVAPPFTSADPNWVSVSGQNQHAESAVTLTWKVLASRPGMAHLARADSLIKILQSDQETKLYGVSVQFELSKVGADRVLFVRRIGGATVSEGFVGNFRDLADELLRTKTVSATTVRGANVELCQFQGKSITVRVDGALPSPPTTQLRVWSFSLAAIVVGAAVLLIAAGGIALLLVLARKGGAAGKTALRVIGVMLLLFGVSVFTLIGLRGSNARQAQVKAELAERALMKNALAADDAAPTHASVATQDPTFGPVIERIINHPGESTNNYFLDLDSGNFMDAPGNVFSLLRVRFDGVTRSGRTDDPIKSWAQTSGADLTLGMTSPEITIVLYGGLISFPTLSFAKADAQEVLKMSTEAAQRYKTNGTPLPPLTMFNRPGFDGDGAVLFQTREGGVGILQIVTSLKSVGSTENPRSVRIRYKLVVAGPGESTRGISLTSMTRPFPLRHKLGSDMAEQLRAILLGRRNSEAAPSADNQEVLVTAPPDVMTRVQTFIIATDWPDKIERGPNYEYPRQTVMRAARSFFYACAIEDAEEAISKLLSPRVLAELKGEAKSRPYKDYYTGGVPDAHWEALLRADWPGKKEALQHLIREWNRYPLKRITEDPGIALGFGVKHFCSVSFEGAPNDFYQITIEPGRTEQGTSQDSFFFSSLPPWWNVNSAYRAAPTTRIVTKPGTYDIKPGLKLVIADGNDEKKSATKRSVAAELIWQAEGETQPSATYGVPLSNGLPYGVAWQEDGKALWISCGAQLGSGVHKHIDRYLRILAIRSPGDVEERTIPTGQPDADAADQETYHAVPEDIRRSFEALDK